MGGWKDQREPSIDFRARATRGVGIAGLVLLLPFAYVNLWQGRYAVAVGTAVMVAALSLNVWLVARGRDHQAPTFWVWMPGGMLFLAYLFRVDPFIACTWCYPAILAGYCMLERRRALIGNIVLLVGAVPMIAMTMPPEVGSRFSVTLLGVSVFAYILVCEIDAMRERLRYQIEHDPLTGLLNRTSLRDRLERAIVARHSRFVPAALLAIDLDHFKRVNDRFGHDTGDAVLCEVARTLRATVRGSDAAFRLGGEEFLVVLDGIAESAACERAEEIRRTIERASILQHHSVTVSVGVAVLRKSDDRGSWTRRADARLYAAKHAGRNRVVSTGAERDAGVAGSATGADAESVLEVL